MRRLDRLLVAVAIVAAVLGLYFNGPICAPSGGRVEQAASGCQFIFPLPLVVGAAIAITALGALLTRLMRAARLAWRRPSPAHSPVPRPQSVSYARGVHDEREPNGETGDWSVELDVDAETEEEATALARRALTAEARQAGQEPDLDFQLVPLENRKASSWWRRLFSR
jgi:hypothetical protein